MREKITSIRPALVDNYMRIIRSLAQRGRGSYHDCLVDPLTAWSRSVPVEPVSTMTREELTARSQVNSP